MDDACMFIQGLLQWVLHATVRWTALLSLTPRQYLPLVLFYFAVSSCVLQVDISVLYHTHTVRGLSGFSSYGFHVILEVAGVIVSLVFLVSWRLCVSVCTQARAYAHTHSCTCTCTHTLTYTSSVHIHIAAHCMPSRRVDYTSFTWHHCWWPRLLRLPTN